MARIEAAEAADMAAIQHLINEWGHELDEHNGLCMAHADILTRDCRYNVGGSWREGIEEIHRFYIERERRLESQGGAPVMRHIISNFRTTFLSKDHARSAFILLFFAHTGTPPFTNYCDPMAVADVQMECRRDAQGEWRISSFNSEQIFRRA